LAASERTERIPGDSFMKTPLWAFSSLRVHADTA
jgi:hypothetical protein